MCDDDIVPSASWNQAMCTKSLEASYADVRELRFFLVHGRKYCL